MCFVNGLKGLIFSDPSGQKKGADSSPCLISRYRQAPVKETQELEARRGAHLRASCFFYIYNLAVLEMKLNARKRKNNMCGVFIAPRWKRTIAVLPERNMMKEYALRRESAREKWG